MYCSKCGKEMQDDAVVCTGCGCLLKTVAETKKLAQQTEKSCDTCRDEELNGKNEHVENICKKATKVLFIVSLGLFCLARILSSYFGIAYLLFLIPGITSFLSLGCSIAGLVLSTKQDSEALKIGSIAMFAASVTLVSNYIFRLLALISISK